MPDLWKGEMEAAEVASTRENSEAKQYHNPGETDKINDSIKNLNDTGVEDPVAPP